MNTFIVRWSLLTQAENAHDALEIASEELQMFLDGESDHVMSFVVESLEEMSSRVLKMSARSGKETR